MALVGMVSLYGLYRWASKDLPDFKKLTDYNPPLVTTVYASKGEILGYFYKEKRFLVTLEEMTPLLPKAFLAAEDSSFYEHDGVDLTAIARAFMVNIKAGGIKQGGSTITQQIIKRLLLTSEKKYERKLKEAILAYRLEHYLTKDEILTVYLNQIFLGAHSYGVESAARNYFGKHATELTLAECAVIAGLPQAPSRYNPQRHPKAAKQRQRYVLERMLAMKWITQEEHDEALNTPLEYKTMPDPSWKIGPYYLEEVRRWLVDNYGEDRVYNGGLHVYTSCDIKHQNAADAALKKGLENSAKRRGWIGPVENLKERDAIQKFLSIDRVEAAELLAGKRLKAVVTKVTPKKAEVLFSAFKGEVPVKSMWWTRELDPSKSHEDVPDTKDATKVLNKGDVIWVSVDSMLKVKGQDYNATLPHIEKDKYILSLEREPLVEGAIVSITPNDGKVVALSGGYSFNRSQYNRATQAIRQPGSAFKPIVYSVAMDNGYTPASMVLDAPIVYTNDDEGKLWRPQNFEGVFYGPTLLRTALVKSRNLVTIRLASKLGIKKIIERAKTMGLKADFPEDLSVALGSGAVSLLNLCEAYTALARGGSYIEPRIILDVKTSWGEDIYKSEPQVHEALSPQTAYIMASLMKHVVQNGTGWRARVLKRPIAGKTGTTNNEQDAWFMGYTPYLLTGVYVGFDQLQPMGKWETGSRAASPIWVSYRKVVENDYPFEDFKQPEGVDLVQIDGKNGLLAGPASEEVYFLPFKSGTAPTEVAQPEGSNPVTGGGGDGEDLFKQMF